MSSGGRRRVSRPWRLVASLLVTGVLLLVVGLAAPLGLPVQIRATADVGEAHTAAVVDPATIVAVNLTDTRPGFTPNSISVNSGANVTFVLHNVGNYSHTFTVSSVTTPLNSSWTPSQLDQFFAEFPPLVNVSLSSGERTNVTLTAPTNASAQTFPIVSLVPYQFQAGLEGNLSVTPTIGGSATISDNTTDALSFVPAAIELNTSKIHFPVNVTVSVTNLGSLPHTWTLVPQPGVNVTPTNFSTYFSTHPPLADVQVPIGGTGSGNFLVGQSGVYMYICEEPGHFASGMYGFLYVNVPIPSTTVVSTQVVYVWVLGAAAALIVIAVILAFAVAYTGRMPKSPTSEYDKPAH